MACSGTCISTLCNRNSITNHILHGLSVSAVYVFIYVLLHDLKHYQTACICVNEGLNLYQLLTSQIHFKCKMSSVLYSYNVY